MYDRQSDSFPPIRPSTWLVCISGYLQPEDKPTGMLRLWERLGAFRSPDIVVALRPWNSDWKQVAENIFEVSAGSSVRVLIFAYSWGAGFGFVQLSRELGKRGIDVESAVLSDPVYRSRWFPRLLAWLALTRFFSIPVPRNVREVAWLYQRENRPWGRQLRKASGARTVVGPGIRLERIHQYMDDAEPFHRICLKAARLVCGEPPTSFSAGVLD